MLPADRATRRMSREVLQSMGTAAPYVSQHRQYSAEWLILCQRICGKSRYIYFFLPCLVPVRVILPQQNWLDVIPAFIPTASAPTVSSPWHGNSISSPKGQPERQPSQNAEPSNDEKVGQKIFFKQIKKNNRALKREKTTLNRESFLWVNMASFFALRVILDPYQVRTIFWHKIWRSVLFPLLNRLKRFNL